jgi:BirA family biotin operon repressor/biotin-[acetyl-CoA-carboxylase] ligase
VKKFGSPQIKWVNDIFLNGKKVCGILAESLLGAANAAAPDAMANSSGGAAAPDAAANSGAAAVILGMGINVATTEFPLELRELAAPLRQHGGAEISRAALAADLLNHFFALYDAGNSATTPTCARQWAENLLAEYTDLSLVIGREITYRQSEETISAVAVAINAAGNLLVRRRDGDLVTLNSGEISVKI